MKVFLSLNSKVTIAIPENKKNWAPPAVLESKDLIYYFIDVYSQQRVFINGKEVTEVLKEGSAETFLYHGSGSSFADFSQDTFLSSSPLAAINFAVGSAAIATHSEFKLTLYQVKLNSAREIFDVSKDQQRRKYPLYDGRKFNKNSFPNDGNGKLFLKENPQYSALLYPQIHDAHSVLHDVYLVANKTGILILKKYPIIVVFVNDINDIANKQPSKLKFTGDSYFQKCIIEE